MRFRLAAVVEQRKLGSGGVAILAREDEPMRVERQQYRSGVGPLHMSGAEQHGCAPPMRVGQKLPGGAVIEAAAGRDPEEHLVRVSELWAKFSAVAADNPASEPRNCSKAGAKSELDSPCRYSSGNTSATFGDFLAHAGRIADANRRRSPVASSIRLSLTRGARTGGSPHTRIGGCDRPGSSR